MVVIKSFWSEMYESNNEDGIYVIHNIPTEYEENWKDVIETVGHLMSVVGDYIDDDVVNWDEFFEDYPKTLKVVSKEFLTERNDIIVQLCDEGCTLARTLKVIGFAFEQIICDYVYDADYDRFVN